MGNTRSKNEDRARAQEALLKPYHSKAILSIKEFWANVSEAQHYAVKRSALGATYFHHFLISEVSKIPEVVKVIHYSGTVTTFLKSASSILATVKEDVLKRDDITTNQLLDVEEGLYLVDDPLYRDLVDPRKAIERARQRLGEHEYDLLVNNCEHFVRWALTGVPSSDQIKCAPASHKLVGAGLNELKGVPYRAVNGAFRASQQSLLAGLEKLTCGSNSRLLQHAAGVTLGAAAATAGATFGLQLLCETLSFIRNTLKKVPLFKEGKMTMHDFKTAIGKDVCTSLLSIIASTIGAVVGQFFIPVPLLGSVVGALLGDLAARFIAPVLNELVVEAFFDFAKWFSALFDKIASVVTQKWLTKAVYGEFSLTKSSLLRP